MPRPLQPAKADDQAPSNERAAAVRPVGAVQAAAKLLRYLSRADRPLGVNLISREVGLYPGTCFNILKTLVAEDLVSFDEPTKTYRLGMGVVALAAPLLQESSHIARFHPDLVRIAERYGVSMALFEITRERMVLVDFALAGTEIRVHHRVGTRFPLLLGAAGRWYARYSGLSETQLRQAFKAVRADNPVGYRQWRKECDAATAVGYGVDRGQQKANITVVSVPVLDQDSRPVLAISASAVAAEFSEAKIVAVAKDLLAVSTARVMRGTTV